MAENEPTPKMHIRAIFSFRGRLIPSNVLMGRARIQISVMILRPDVTGNLSVDVFYYGGGRAIQ